MKTITDITALEALYGMPAPAAARKVTPGLTPEYRRWVEASRFCLVATVGPEGTDCSPRGDDGSVVRIADDWTLFLPDWKGNDRIDTLRNVVRDPRLSLLFMVPGSNNVLRVNGLGAVTADDDLRESFARKGVLPRSVLIIETQEVYFQCARAIMRSRLWTAGDEAAGLPTPGEMLVAATAGQVGGPEYDRTWPERAAKTMW
ncbi:MULTISPECIES: pyridoxamine 5'-phosphate oxidase family protein [unclassified Haematobacter]|uniref:pyridoxamine 5'-phosphate oxidase family protein n=1 Tax=unclassified Haematobacter TaxID=2640585 RepID=UPI0025C69F8F|nr:MULTISPECIES: pyridoxamine 5'-phosphate oxidase family protein [unclassified Haematobacter]